MIRQDRHITRTGYIGRFAPSPTGPLHFGSLVSAVGSYLDARSKRGNWLVRIDDLDRTRERAGAADRILRALEQFGMGWDGPVLYQSRHTDAYEEALLQLERKQLVYRCNCSRKTVRQAATDHGIEGPVYPGTCLSSPPDPEKPAAIRFKASTGLCCFDDRLQGKVCQNVAKDIGDFVIRRIDRLFAYQLAVVVDDHLQHITDVVRGADLLISTPRQIQLQRVLGYATPRYCHLPLVYGEDGRKLSKCDDAHAVDPANPLPGLLAALDFLGQELPPDTPASLSEFWSWALRHWKIERVPRSRKSF